MYKENIILFSRLKERITYIHSCPRVLILETSRNVSRSIIIVKEKFSLDPFKFSHRKSGTHYTRRDKELPADMMARGCLRKARARKRGNEWRKKRSEIARKKIQEDRESRRNPKIFSEA